MDRFGKHISLILEGLFLSKKKKKELEYEIRDHLDMTKRELIEAGYSEEKAEVEAIQRFGKTEEVKERFKSLFTPYWRWKEMMSEKKVLTEVLQWTFSIVGALVISLSVRSYVFAQTEVKQVSMQNTLFEGQRLIEYKVEYYYSTPKKGDIVIINREAEKGIVRRFVANTKEFVEGFYKDEEDKGKRLIKRVVGVPGDEIDVREGKVYLNGKLYDEPYVKGVTFPKEMKFPVIVPEKEYFVMGDNRESSMDSRDIGFINVDHIEGKAIFRVWPLDKFGKVNN